MWPDSFPLLSRCDIKHAPLRRSVQRFALRALYHTALRLSYATPLWNVSARSRRRKMPSSWNFLRRLLHGLYL